MRVRKNIGKFRSGLEFDFAQQLSAMKIPVRHETNKFEYVKTHTYCPDFKITDSIFVETKGRFSGADRKKMVLTREQNPGLKFILAFQDPHIKLSKASKTTYAMWCDKNDFRWFNAKDSNELINILGDLGIDV